jgi:hypothetical protein
MSGVDDHEFFILYINFREHQNELVFHKDGKFLGRPSNYKLFNENLNVTYSVTNHMLGQR